MPTEDSGKRSAYLAVGNHSRIVEHEGLVVSAVVTVVESGCFGEMYACVYSSGCMLGGSWAFFSLCVWLSVSGPLVESASEMCTSENRRPGRLYFAQAGRRFSRGGAIRFWAVGLGGPRGRVAFAGARRSPAG